jgi:hypothetical protein
MRKKHLFFALAAVLFFCFFISSCNDNGKGEKIPKECWDKWDTCKKACDKDYDDAIRKKEVQDSLCLVAYDSRVRECVSLNNPKPCIDSAKAIRDGCLKQNKTDFHVADSTWNKCRRQCLDEFIKCAGLPPMDHDD